MLTLNELLIHDQKAEPASLPQRVEAALANGWQRDLKLEQRLRGNARDCCFTCSDAPGRPRAALWLQSRSADEWHVADIVPLAAQNLRDDEYDAILKDFQAILGAANGTLCVKMVSAQRQPDGELSPEGRRRLKEFSCMADRTSPLEKNRELWDAFVVQAHRDDSWFDSQALDGWLAREGWLPEQRRELVGNYELGLGLLARNDEERSA